MNLDLDKFKSITWLTLLLLIVTLIFPGILFVFSFNRELFLKLDLIKLILLGVAITTPIWLLNSFIMSIMSKEAISENENLQLTGIVGSIISIPILYLPILINFFFNITSRTGVIILLSIQLCIIIFSIIDHLVDVNKEKKKHLK